MKFKKIMIVTFLLLAVLTVGVVSASEDITLQDLGVSENAEEVSIDASVGDEVISGDGDEIIASSENDVISDENLSEGGDDENPFGIYVNEDEIITNTSDEGYNEDATIAEIVLPSDTDGCFNAFVNNEELFSKNMQDESSWSLDELGNKKCSVFLKDINLNNLSDDADVEFTLFINGEQIEEYTKFMKVQVTDSTIRFYNGGSDDQWDGEDGVIINVFNGDDREFDLNSDLEIPFALISVSNDIQGFIRIYIYNDGEDKWNIFFEKSLSEITNKETDEENDGFTIYSISLNDFGDKLNDVLDERYFEIGFWSDDDNRIDNRAYNIEYDDSESNVKFWENDGDDEGIHGEGEEIIAEFTNANKLNNGVVVSIPKDNVPDDVDDEFTVIISQDEPKEITFKLTEILDGDNYVIRVNDLQLPEFEESCEIQLILQFYREGEKAYYAQWWDDEFGIRIYQSPFICDESSLLRDDDVITIQEIPEGVDEFTVTISKEGSEDIVKTFKFSEMDNDDEEPWVAFKLADLGITEIGDYEITVSYSDVLNYTGNLNVNKNVDIRGPDEDDNGNPKTFTSVNQRVVHFRIAESIKGYVKVYMDGNQVGENLNLSDLKFGSVAPEDGRHIILNDLNITESGEYAVKVELYSEADELLGEDEFNITVKVGENSVTIKGSYAYGTEANDEIIEFTIGSPLSDGQYFNIYFNGVKAGEITANGLEFNDVFTTPMWGVKIFKPGNYNVNVTFFDGESETDMANGTISINELTLSSDKEVYIIDEDSIIISFNMDSVADGDRLRAYYVYFWGPVGRDDSMIFNPYGGDQLKEDGLYKDGVVSFDVAWITDEKGIDHFRLDEGTTLIYVEYKNGNGEIYGGFIEINVIEEPEIVPVDPTLKITPVSDVEEGSDVLIEVSANETFTGVVNVLIGENVVATVNVVEGYGIVTVAAGNFTVGVNTVKVNCSAGELFTEGFDEVTFSVNQKIIPPTPVDPALKISVANIIEGADAVIVITTNETFSGNVLVQIGTSNYTVPVVNGAGSLPVSGLAVGEHTVKAIFDATEGFTSGEANTVFSVTAKPVTPTTPTTPTTPKAPTKKADVIKLTLKTVKVKKSAKKLVLQATLKINGKYAKKGTNVKFRFNGKTYNAKIGKKGVAKLTIKKKVLKKLKAGKKVKYQVSYGKKTVKKTVKVKR